MLDPRRSTLTPGHSSVAPVAPAASFGLAFAATYLRFEVFFERRDPGFSFDPFFGMKRLL
jgi:hypothetical protein